MKREQLQSAGAFALAVLAAFVTGAPAAFLLMAVNFLEPWFVAHYLQGAEAALAYQAVSVLVALALFVIAGAVIPVIWRKTADPRMLRLLAYAGGQVLAAAVGLLIPWLIPSLVITWMLSGINTVVWWAWQRQWRGVGIAPSLLAGVLRPRIHPGQIWYAQVEGAKQSKVRPVLVLAPADTNGWHVAYFTSTTPQPRYVHERVKVRTGTIRGMTRETWVQCADKRILKRSDFHSYNGIAPTWLYSAVCAKAGIPVSLDARTVDENSAGDRPGPWEEQVLSTIGLRSFLPPPSQGTRNPAAVRPTVASLTEAAQFLSQAGRHHLGVTTRPRPKRTRKPHAGE